MFFIIALQMMFSSQSNINYWVPIPTWIYSVPKIWKTIEIDVLSIEFRICSNLLKSKKAALFNPTNLLRLSDKRHRFLVLANCKSWSYIQATLLNRHLFSIYLYLSYSHTHAQTEKHIHVHTHTNIWKKLSTEFLFLMKIIWTMKKVCPDIWGAICL